MTWIDEAAGAELIGAIESSELVMALRFDERARLLACNELALRFFGWRAAAVLGKRPSAGLMPPEEAATLEAELRATFRSSASPSAIEIGARRPQGGARWGRFSFRPLVRDGVVESVLVLGVDETPRHVLEATIDMLRDPELERPNSLFEALTSTIAGALGVDVAAICDATHPERGVIETLAGVVDGQEAPYATFPLHDSPCGLVLAAGAPRAWNGDVQAAFPEMASLRELGMRTYVGVPLIDANRRSLGTLSILDRERLDDVDEVTRLLEYFALHATSELERRTIAEERRALAEREREAQHLESIATLARGVAHDFNNLVTGILGMAWLVDQHREEPAQVQRLAARIEHTADRAADLTRKLLGFASEGKNRHEEVDLHAVARRVVEEERDRLPAEATIEFAPGSAEAVVFGDPEQLEAVLRHLVSNACDALRRGGRVRVSSSWVDVGRLPTPPAAGLAAEPHLRLIVEDDGVGISAAHQSRIFDPFFTTKPIGSGSGLGLAMVYGILRAHGGGIEFSSAENEGARFEVYLPRGRAHR